VTDDQPRHDGRASFVVIGTSAGGENALSQVFRSLPAGFPGAVLVVIHVFPQRDLSWLAAHLTRSGQLSVKLAEDGERIMQGAAYLAPAASHLLVEEDRLRLGQGPVEQHARPSIDVLFRSAAAAFGRRLIGVILSGMLRDGTVGLRHVRDAGGITIVQNPESTEAGEMPRSAMEGLSVDYCLDLAEIGPLLELLVRRAGPYKEGILETGLASALRLMKDRAALLTKLYAQSRDNPKTSAFLASEIAALDRELASIRELIATR
jgi:two-component system, chemotaxis family, protein-glutamate methylesterase/glutaminase